MASEAVVLSEPLSVSGFDEPAGSGQTVRVFGTGLSEVTSVEAFVPFSREFFRLSDRDCIWPRSLSDLPRQSM
jgi:hypothetical protein